jgi:hypothetical protein
VRARPAAYGEGGRGGPDELVGHSGKVPQKHGSGGDEPAGRGDRRAIVLALQPRQRRVARVHTVRQLAQQGRTVLPTHRLPPAGTRPSTGSAKERRRAQALWCWCPARTWEMPCVPRPRRGQCRRRRPPRHVPAAVPYRAAVRQACVCVCVCACLQREGLYLAGGRVRHHKCLAGRRRHPRIVHKELRAPRKGRHRHDKEIL